MSTGVVVADWIKRLVDEERKRELLLDFSTAFLSALTSGLAGPVALNKAFMGSERMADPRDHAVDVKFSPELLEQAREVCENQPRNQGAEP